MLPGSSGFGRGFVVECGVQPSVVVVGDPVFDVAARGRVVGPEADADLGLDGREERLRCGAVETRAASAGALPDLQTV